MKIIRSIAMYTDHSYHGVPLEVSGVTLYCSDLLTKEQIEIAKNSQVMKLHSMAKRMPPDYWKTRRLRAAQGD